jgi:hypothetical protein
MNVRKKSGIKKRERGKRASHVHLDRSSRCLMALHEE